MTGFLRNENRICRPWRSDPTAFVPAAYSSCQELHLLQYRCSAVHVEGAAWLADISWLLNKIGFSANPQGPVPRPCGLHSGRRSEQQPEVAGQISLRGYPCGAYGRQGHERLTQLGFLGLFSPP